MNERPTSSRVVLRGSLGIVVVACIALLGVVLLVDALVRGDWPVAVMTASAFGVLAWLAWWLLAEPALVVTPAGLQIVSPLRVRFLPWDRVARLEPRFLLTIVTTDGERVRAAGAPTAGIDRAIGVRDLDVRRGDPASVLVSAARDALEGSPADARAADTRSGVRWGAVATAAALLAGAALATALVAPYA